MYFTLFSYFTNIVYLLKTPINLKDKFTIFLTYSFLTIISIIPFFPKPKTVKIINFQILGFNFHTLHYLIGEIFVKNEYFFESNKQRPLILDCGSNIGVSVIYFKFLYPNCHIHAFEPDPETFELLKQNVQINNLKNVYLHNAAVSNSEKDLDFYISEEKGNLMMSTLRERMSEAKIRVKSISLSKFIESMNIDFMKMDIEGSEGVVLQDLVKKKQLHRIQEMIIEYHHNIAGNSVSFSSFLSLIETQYKYQVDTSSIPIYSKNKFQDILLFTYKK